MGKQWDIDLALKSKAEDSIDSFQSEISIAYALSLGLYKDPQLQKEDLKYVYELHDDFTTFPTFAATVNKTNAFWEKYFFYPGIPEFNPMNILHGEEKLELFKPIQPDQKYISQGRIGDIQDKGKNTVLKLDVYTYEYNDGKKGDLCFREQMTIFVRGLKGSNFKGTGDHIQIPSHVPKREHDAQWEEKTEKNQAILYRLSGDKNPLHVDSDLSQAMGYDTPILHGMNFYGLAAKAIINKFCQGDEKQLKSLAARFTGHVFPGESIVFRLWKENDNTIIFKGIVTERQTQCIIGVAELNTQAKL